MKDGKCSQCGPNNKYCMKEDGNAPEFCSTLLYKEALERADKKYDDPVLNRAYQEMADYYDTTIMPARVRKPKDYIQKKIISNYLKITL